MAYTKPTGKTEYNKREGESYEEFLNRMKREQGIKDTKKHKVFKPTGQEEGPPKQETFKGQPKKIPEGPTITPTTKRDPDKDSTIKGDPPPKKLSEQELIEKKYKDYEALLESRETSLEKLKGAIADGVGIDEAYSNLWVLERTMSKHLLKNYFNQDKKSPQYEYYRSKLNPERLSRYTEGQNKFTKEKAKKWGVENVGMVAFSGGRRRIIEGDPDKDSTTIKNPDSLVLRSQYDREIEQGTTPSKIGFEEWKSNLPDMETRLKQWKETGKTGTFHDFLVKKRTDEGIAYYNPEAQEPPTPTQKLRGKTEPAEPEPQQQEATPPKEKIGNLRGAKPNTLDPDPSTEKVSTTDDHTNPSVPPPRKIKSDDRSGMIGLRKPTGTAQDPIVSGLRETPAEMIGERKEVEDSQRAKKTIDVLKNEIKALHTLFDDNIPEFKEEEHTKKRDDVLKSKDLSVVREHHANMEYMVSRYYKEEPKMRLGVIVDAEDFLAQYGFQQKPITQPSTEQRVDDPSKMGTMLGIHETFVSGGLSVAKGIPVQSRLLKHTQRTHEAHKLEDPLSHTFVDTYRAQSVRRNPKPMLDIKFKTKV